MKPAILFVDDNENILQGLRRNMRPMHQEWDMHFAINGVEALKVLGQKPIDVIVSDIRMPVMDGVALLQQACEKYPNTVRLVLSGQCDEEAIATLLEVSHQYMAKPQDTAVIIAVIKNILAVKARLADEGLKKFVTGIKALPTLPSLRDEILAALQADHPSTQEIENLLLRDLSLVAKIFQMMNSSYFGAAQDNNTIAFVWEVLGLERIKRLTQGGHIIAPPDPALKSDAFMADLWATSLLTARMARLIAKTEGLPQKSCDKAWVAGLLHNIGAEVLYEYQRCAGAPAADNASDTGFFLATLWGLPLDIRNVIRHHAAPEKAAAEEGDAKILAMVHAARHFAFAAKNEADKAPLSSDFMKNAGVDDRIAAWKSQAETII